MQEAHFTVSLCDYPELPEDKRQQAEARYARVLARQLGGEEQVGEALSLVQGLEDTPRRNHRRRQAHLPALDESRPRRCRSRPARHWRHRKLFFDVRRIYH